MSRIPDGAAAGRAACLCVRPHARRQALVATVAFMSLVADARAQGVSTAYFDKFRSVRTPTKVDPANPPEYLRVRAGGGHLFLVKTSVRREDYFVALCGKGNSKKKLDAGPVRTYQGWCEEQPDSMVSAILMPDGKMWAWVLRALSSGGNPGGGDSVVLSNSKATFVSGPPSFKAGKPYKGATFIKANQSGDPHFSKCTLLDQKFVTLPEYFEVHKDRDNPAGYLSIFLGFEFNSVGFDLISKRDGLEAFRVSSIVLTRPGSGRAEFPQEPSDVVCKVRSGGGGGAGPFSRYDANSGYESSVSYKNKAMWHELGHKLRWGGDHVGTGVEPGLLGGGGGIRFGGPAVEHRRRGLKGMRNEPEYIPTPDFPIPPYARFEQLGVMMNAPVVIDILANDFDVNGGHIALAGFETTTSGGGKIEFLPRGGPGGRDVLSYVPATDFLGEDRFSYSIVDSDGRGGYGNVLLRYGSANRLISYLPFEDVDDFNEFGAIEDVVTSKKDASVGVNWHKHRHKPFLVFWDVSRDVGLNGYFDAIKPPIYDLKSGLKPWKRKEFSFSIAGQPYLDSAAGIFDLTFHRWQYSSVWQGMAKQRHEKHPQSTVIVHEVALTVDGEVVARTAGNTEVKLLPDKCWNTGRYGYRLKIDDLDGPGVRQALQIAASAKGYIFGKKGSGPKVELKVLISKTSGAFQGGLMMTPVDPAFENLPGRYGKCVKVHGFEQVNYVPATDANTHRSLCVWAYAPSWEGLGRNGAMVLKFRGHNGIGPYTPRGGSSSSRAFGYKHVHVSPNQWYTFAMPKSGRWFHLAWVIGDDVKIYVDGKLATTAPRIFQKMPPLGALGFNFIGAFDDLRIYSGTLTPVDVARIMMGGGAEWIAPLQGSLSVKSGVLQWVPGANAIEQRVYFGEGKRPHPKPVATLDGQSGEYRVRLNPRTAYSWRVDTILQNRKMMKGKVWTFATGIPRASDIASRRKRYRPPPPKPGDTTPGDTGGEGKPPEVESEAVPDRATLAARWEGRLTARIKEELAAGRKPRFLLRSVRQRANVLSLDDDGTMLILCGGAELPWVWSSLSTAERRGLAVGMLRVGTASDHALAAYFMLLTGNEVGALEHLDRCGALAAEVRQAVE